MSTTHPALFPRFLRPPYLAALAALSLGPPGAFAEDAGRRVLQDSVRAVEPGPASPATIVRSGLTAAELASPMTIGVSLRMRNFAEFRARLALGQNLPNGRLSRAEMEETYLPPEADYSAVRDWLEAQGMEIVQEDANHTTVFARASVEKMAQAFQVSFARVATPQGEFTSAVTAPSLPTALAASVLGVDGLQPHIRAHQPPSAIPQAGSRPTGSYVSPADIRAAYSVPSGLNGSGQTIAIIMSSEVPTADLQHFWTTAEIPQAIGNFTTIPVDGGPDSTDQTNLALEVAIDTDWASSVAPSAKVRLYAIPQLLFSEINQACLRILQDAQSDPSISVVSMSIGGPEIQLSLAGYQAYTQTFAQLAAAGITCLACSGDGGSNPNPDLTNGYSSSFPLSPEYPASDPDVTAVGGTTLTFTSSWTYSSEVAWSTISTDGAGTGGTAVASGGGVSEFPRESWQSDGEPVLSAYSASRCVPDVAAISMAMSMLTDPPTVTYSSIVYKGTLTGCYGTSLATPIWAAFVAMLNQRRAANGAAPIGLLGPAIYPLHGTGAFIDITSGSNGMYSAGPGFDLCTGLGSPNVANLVAALSGLAPAGTPPAGNIAQAAPPSPLSAGSSLALSATSSGPGTVAYQWYLNGAAIPGATGADYRITAGAEDAGAYTVTLTGAGGSTSLDAGTLTVTTDAWLTDLSARAYVEGSPNLLIAGFVTTGGSAKTILVRGSGPALTAFDISDFLANPQLSLDSSSGATLASNTAWDAGLAPEFVSLGAFPFPPGSNDTAILMPVPAGAYTALVSSGTAENGVAAAEIYDADAGAPANRLVNIAARAYVGTGTNVLIGGFVVAGTTSETVIVRGVGPALAEFSLTGLLSNPVLSVFDQSGALIARDTGWENPVETSGAAAENATLPEFASVHAFALGPGSTDSAMVLTLPPGNYTAELSGAADSVAPAGIGLVEIYELR